MERLTEVLAARPEIQEAYLFGSRARGRPRPDSDIDIAVYVDQAKCPNPVFGYEADLSTTIMGATGRLHVDLVVLNQAPPLLYERVLRGGIRLLARHLPATTTREGRALSRYCDYVPQLRKIDAAHIARTARGTFGR
jgi:predicted nucleotidyltransferase